MVALLNHRHELFAKGLVEGKTADQAFVDAGYKRNRCNASRLRTNENIIKRIAELQGHHQQRHDVTVDTLTKEYEGAREMALDNEQPSAAISATSGKARLHGLDKGDGGVAINIQSPPPVQLSKLELARRWAHILDVGAMEAKDAKD